MLTIDNNNKAFSPKQVWVNYRILKKEIVGWLDIIRFKIENKWWIANDHFNQALEVAAHLKKQANCTSAPSRFGATLELEEI